MYARDYGELRVGMMDINYIVAAFIFGVYLGASLERWALAKAQLRKNAQQETEELNTNKRGIYVEEHQNKLFAYDINTHQFLCSFTNYKDLHNTLSAIDANSTWVFYEDSRVLIESYMRRQNGTDVAL